MKYKQDTFIWSENWWIEGDNAWFIEGGCNILFCINLKTQECEEAIDIPDACSNKYKLTPYCMKHGNVVICIPGLGQYIWIYHLDDRAFSRIVLDKQEEMQWAVEIWKWRDTVFLVLDRCNKIIELDVVEGRIINSYTICDDNVVRSTMAEDSIFLLSSESDMIYQFECETRHVRSYKLPDIGKKYFNIIFDGETFWLSGYEKEIYKWNQANNCLTVLDHFPKSFIFYDHISMSDGELAHNRIPTFFYVIAVGKYVWFIPTQANMIIYVDKSSDKVNTFEIYEGDETNGGVLSWTEGLFQYLWEYVREDRFIGLFSAEKNRIVEIDTEKMEYQWKDYCIGNKCVKQCDQIFNGMYAEGHMLHYKLYKERLQVSDYFGVSLNNSIGREIFKNLQKEST